MKNKAVCDLSQALRNVVDRHIQEYDISIGEILGCFESVKYGLCKEFHPYEIDREELEDE